MRGQIPPSAAYPRELVTLGDHIRARRLDRGLGQRDVARLIGVSTSTINGWETVGREPEVRYLPAIIAFLGYNPEPEPTSFRCGSHSVAWMIGVMARLPSAGSRSWSSEPSGPIAGEPLRRGGETRD